MANFFTLKNGVYIAPDWLIWTCFIIIFVYLCFRLARVLSRRRRQEKELRFLVLRYLKMKAP